MKFAKTPTEVLLLVVGLMGLVAVGASLVRLRIYSEEAETTAMQRDAQKLSDWCTSSRIGEAWDESALSKAGFVVGPSANRDMGEIRVTTRAAFNQCYIGLASSGSIAKVGYLPD